MNRKEFTYKLELSIKILPDIKNRLNKIKKQSNMPWKQKSTWYDILYNHSIKQLLELERHDE